MVAKGGSQMRQKVTLVSRAREAYGVPSAPQAIRPSLDVERQVTPVWRLGYGSAPQSGNVHPQRKVLRGDD